MLIKLCTNNSLEVTLQRSDIALLLNIIGITTCRQNDYCNVFPLLQLIFNFKPLSTLRLLENSSPRPYPCVPSTEQFCICTVKSRVRRGTGGGIESCFGKEVVGWCICFRPSLKCLPRKTVNSELTSVIPLWFWQYFLMFFEVYESNNLCIDQTIIVIFIITCNVSL